VRIEHFKYLSEIEKSGSISSAAKILYMGQTTLSSMLKTLENEVGFDIFHRTPNGVYPTKKGAELLKICREINSKMDKINFLKDGQWYNTEPIHITLCPSINMCSTLELSNMFFSKYQECKIFFHEENRIKIPTTICNSNRGIGLTYLLNHEIENCKPLCLKYGLAIEEILKDKFFLCVSRKHALAQMELIDINELHSYKYVTCTNYDSEMFKDFQKSHPNFISLSNMYLVLDAILTDEMFGFFTGYFSSFRLNKDLFSIIPITGLDFENIIKICLITKKEENLRYFEKKMLLCINEYFNKWSLYK